MKTSSEKKKDSSKASFVKDEELTKNDREFIYSKGGNTSLRWEIYRFSKKYDISISLFEPGFYDFAIIRFGKKKDNYGVVYDFDKLAELLAKDYMKYYTNIKMKYTKEQAINDAIEFIDYNTIRTIPYMGEHAPKLVYKDEDGKERIC